MKLKRPDVNTLKLINSVSLVQLFYFSSIINVDCSQSIKLDHLSPPAPLSSEANIIVGRRPVRNRGLDDNNGIITVQDDDHRRLIGELNKKALSSTLKSAMLVSAPLEDFQDKPSHQLGHKLGPEGEKRSFTTKRERNDHEPRDVQQYRTAPLIGDHSLSDILAKSTSSQQQYNNQDEHEDGHDSERKVHFQLKKSKAISSPYERADSQNADTKSNMLERGSTDLANEQNAAIIETTTPGVAAAAEAPAEPIVEDVHCNRTTLTAVIVLPESFVIAPEFNDLNVTQGALKSGLVERLCTITRIKYRLYPTFRLVARDYRLCGATLAESSPLQSASETEFQSDDSEKQAGKRRRRRQRRRVDGHPPGTSTSATIYRPAGHGQDVVLLNIRFPMIKSLRTDEDNYATIVCTPSDDLRQQTGDDHSGQDDRVEEDRDDGDHGGRSGGNYATGSIDRNWSSNFNVNSSTGRNNLSINDDDEPPQMRMGKPEDHLDEQINLANHNNDDDDDESLSASMFAEESKRRQLMISDAIKPNMSSLSTKEPSQQQRVYHIDGNIHTATTSATIQLERIVPKDLIQLTASGGNNSNEILYHTSELAAVSGVGVSVARGSKSTSSPMNATTERQRQALIQMSNITSYIGGGGGVDTTKVGDGVQLEYIGSDDEKRTEPRPKGQTGQKVATAIASLVGSTDFRPTAASLLSKSACLLHPNGAKSKDAASGCGDSAAGPTNSSKPTRPGQHGGTAPVTHRNDSDVATSGSTTKSRHVTNLLDKRLNNNNTTTNYTKSYDSLQHYHSDDELDRESSVSSPVVPVVAVAGFAASNSSNATSIEQPGSSQTTMMMMMVTRMMNELEQRQSIISGDNGEGRLTSGRHGAADKAGGAAPSSLASSASMQTSSSSTSGDSGGGIGSVPVMAVSRVADIISSMEHPKRSDASQSRRRAEQQSLITVDSDNEARIQSTIENEPNEQNNKNNNNNNSNNNNNNNNNNNDDDDGGGEKGDSGDKLLLVKTVGGKTNLTRATTTATMADDKQLNSSTLPLQPPPPIETATSIPLDARDNSLSLFLVALVCSLLMVVLMFAILADQNLLATTDLHQ